MFLDGARRRGIMCILNTKLLFVQIGGFAEIKAACAELDGKPPVCMRKSFGTMSAEEETYMVKRLQKIKSKRGFTTIELIVVVAIIGVLVASVLVSSTNRRDRVKAANSAAQDFYSAMQSECMQLQMFDGPLTATLAKEYAAHWTGATSNNIRNAGCAGVKYYPKVGGNYPYDGFVAGENHLTDMPKSASYYVEVRVIGGVVKHVDYANQFSVMAGRTGASVGGSELGAVLLQEMKNRIEYRDGFYYAKVSYTAPALAPGGNTPSDYSSVPVKVDWAAYSSREMTATASTNTFKTQNITESGAVLGTYGSANLNLGAAGSSLSTM